MVIDDSINISTSQNVTINYQIASVGDRILASLLDWLIKFGMVLLVIFIFYNINAPADKWWLAIILVLPVMFYSLIFETIMQGQTPGKRVMKIKVVKMDGGQASFGSYVLRWIMRLLDTDFMYGIIAIITIVVNKKGQRVGDILAGTTVIKVKDRVSLKDTIYEKLNSDYVVKYPEAKKLNSAEIELIKKVLNIREYSDNFEMVFNLTNKIQAKMGVTREEGQEDFLRTVVKDYNALVDE